MKPVASRGYAVKAATTFSYKGSNLQIYFKSLPCVLFLFSQDRGLSIAQKMGDSFVHHKTSGRQWFGYTSRYCVTCRAGFVRQRQSVGRERDEVQCSRKSDQHWAAGPGQGTQSSQNYLIQTLRRELLLDQSARLRRMQ